MEHRPLSAAEVADWLSVDVQAVYAEIERGNLKAFKAGREWRITRQALDEYTT